jgi:cysteine desulfurase
MPPSEPIYLDHNATAPLLPQVLERMTAAARNLPGNASSPHRFGQAARAALEQDRETVAAALGFSRRDTTFNSGGSEGNNTALHWLAETGAPAHLITSPIEHPSVLRTAEWLSRNGVAVSYLPVDSDGRVDPAALEGLLRPETKLLSVMAANNETGVIQPLAALGAVLREKGVAEQVLFHSDAVQAFGRVPLSLREWGVQACTVTAHKLGGPKGIGAFVCVEKRAPPPLIRGGAQERGRRAGTESVFLAEGFAAAIDYVSRHQSEVAARWTTLAERLVELLGGEGGLFVNGGSAERLPNTLNLGFEGVDATSLLTALDLEGVAVSSGSACSSGAVEPSHVLQAMGLPMSRIRSSVRISMGHGTTEADIDCCAEAMRRQVRRIRTSSQPRKASA